METKKQCYFCGSEITNERVDTIKCNDNGVKKLVLICKKCLRELREEGYDIAEREQIKREDDDDE